MKHCFGSSKILRKIVISISVMILTAAFIPVYGEEISSETERVQVYEEQAESWRFHDGYMREDISETEGSSMKEGSSLFGARSAFEPWSKTDEGFISSDGKVIEGAVRKGIDVSYFQGEIDWDKVKADGIDFAILRCGYGGDYTDQDDSTWLRNVKECERVGMPYGVYLYSYANTEAKARSEAAHTLRLLEEAGADPDYPVFYDLEDKTVEGAGKTAIIKQAEIYCSALEAEGYEAGIYANLNWWNNILNDPALDKYDRWVAQYYHKCSYEGEYMIWQCASDGTVDGISGNVDINFEIGSEEEQPRTVKTKMPMKFRMNSGADGIVEGIYRADTEFDIVKIQGKWGKTADGCWINLEHTYDIKKND